MRAMVLQLSTYAHVREAKRVAEKLVLVDFSHNISASGRLYS